MSSRAGGHPVTPDGRYFVVRGRLWRMANPNLSADRREMLVRRLMAARRAVGVAKRSGDQSAEDKAHADVGEAKIALGERGEPWWTDDAPDLNRHMVKNTPTRPGSNPCDTTVREGRVGLSPALARFGLMAHSKPYLPTKDCAACGRPFAWRKKWARDWDNVKYCSDRCRSGAHER